LPRTTARISVALRVGLLVFAVALGPMGVVAPVSWRWVGPALVLLALWTLAYGLVAVRRGLVPWLVVADLVVTAAAGLVIGELVPVERVTLGATWVGILLTVCVMGVGLAWPAWASVPAGLAVTAAYVVGCRLAGAPEAGTGHAFVVVTQVVAVAAVMALVRRARTAADAAFVEAQAARLRASIERSRRADERRQLVLLHDTALATLTMVGAGAITASSPRLRERAARDVAAFDGLRGIPDPKSVRLDERLATVARDVPASVTVTVDATPCVVPGQVAEAFLGGVEEALANVVRHSGSDRAVLAVEAAGDRIVVRVVDHGRGFDPEGVPAHRYGVRDSIAARMRGVGGTARVASAPGRGTEWVMQWSRD
jgi:signal transduction histidine kinase